MAKTAWRTSLEPVKRNQYGINGMKGQSRWNLNYINGKYIKTFLACGQNGKSPQKLKQTKQIYTLF